MRTVVIERAKAKGKKWLAVFEDGTTTSFGSRDYDDFTTHKDEARQRSYLARHSKDPHTITSAGELSRTLLWSSPSWTEAKKNFEKKHGVRVIWRR